MPKPSFSRPLGQTNLAEVCASLTYRRTAAQVCFCTRLNIFGRPQRKKRDRSFSADPAQFIGYETASVCHEHRELHWDERICCEWDIRYPQSIEIVTRCQSNIHPEQTHCRRRRWQDDKATVWQWCSQSDVNQICRQRTWNSRE